MSSKFAKAIARGVREISVPNDRVTLTRVSGGTAVIEVGGVDMYSQGISDVAYAFLGLEYIELPVEMEFVYLREIDDPPDRVPRDGKVFEFYEKDARSDGGQVIVVDGQIIGGHWEISTVGFIVAQSCEAYRGDLPSGNRWRHALGDDS